MIRYRVPISFVMTAKDQLTVDHYGQTQIFVKQMIRYRVPTSFVMTATDQLTVDYYGKTKICKT